MGTRGFFAYRYKGTYYRRYLSCAAYPSGHGQRLYDSIPRDLSAFKEWVTSKSKILENTKTGTEEVIHPHLSEADSLKDIRDDGLGYELCQDSDWTFVDGESEYTYVIDLDNLAFTVNGIIHLKLDYMLPSEPGLEAYFEDEDRVKIPLQYIQTTVNLWPALRFDTEERQQQYKALNATIVPPAEWGTLSWEDLSVSQRFSIDLTHHVLSKTSHEMGFVYAPSVQKKIGIFCWNILCATTASVPLCCDNIGERSGPFNRTLSPPSPTGSPRFRPYEMIHETGIKPFKLSENVRRSRAYDNHYCWVRDRLITFCVRLDDPACLAHEVEQMVRRMRRDGHTECVGLILSSQQEVVAVAVDDVPEGAGRVRHTPVLSIRTCPDKPGHASEGLLLMVHLLSPILTVPPLPWRTPRPRESSLVWNRLKLPLEVFQQIIRYTDTWTYISLRQVSKSIRSLCLANPRYGEYTILYKMPQYELTYAAQFANDDEPIALYLFWDRQRYCNLTARWNAWEYSLEGSEGEDESDESQSGEEEEEVE